MKKFLTLLLSGLALAACSDSGDTPAPTPEVSDRSLFRGTMNVEPRSGSSFSAFSAEDIVFGVLCQTDGNLTLDIPKIKFVEQMPVWIAFEVRDLTRNMNTSTLIEFGTERTLPYWNGAPFDPEGDGKYEITDLKGSYDPETKQLHVTFNCYTMRVDYLGQWDASSLELK